MKTTPNPNATKKSNGELEGEFPPVGGVVVCTGGAVVVVDVGARGRVVEVVPPAACGLRATNLKTSPTACSMIATIVAAVVLDGRGGGGGTSVRLGDGGCSARSRGLG